MLHPAVLVGIRWYSHIVLRECWSRPYDVNIDVDEFYHEWILASRKFKWRYLWNGWSRSSARPIDFMFDSRVGLSWTADLMEILPVEPNPRWRPTAILKISNNAVCGTGLSLSINFIFDWCGTNQIWSWSTETGAYTALCIMLQERTCYRWVAWAERWAASDGGKWSFSLLRQHRAVEWQRWDPRQDDWSWCTVHGGRACRLVHRFIWLCIR